MPMRGWILCIHNVARPLARPWTGVDRRGGGERKGEGGLERKSGPRIEQKRSARYIEFPLGPRPPRSLSTYRYDSGPLVSMGNATDDQLGTRRGEREKWQVSMDVS